MAALLLLGLVVLFGGVYVAGYLFTGERVPSRASVAGVRIGGMTPAAAERKLSQELGPRASRPVVADAGDERALIRPRSAGLSLDVDESVAQAGGGRSWHPGRMWNYFFGGESYDPVVSVDDDRLQRAVERAAQPAQRAPRQGTVSFAGGRPEASWARPGRSVDEAAAADAVQSAYQAGLSADVEPVEFPVQTVDPEITNDEVRQALEEFANPAMSAPVVVDLDGEAVELRPKAYAGALSMTARDGELVPVLDEKALLRGIRPTLQQATVPPRDASVGLVRGRPQVVPGRVGVTFDKADITDQFLDVLTRKGDARRLEVDGVKDRPSFTTADARGLGIKRVVSQFTTYYPHADYRNTNLGRAAELVNGTVLKPGDTFSLNDTVGERTAANGFVKGFIISDGIYEEDFGGGVSQVATTLFNAAFFAGLEDVEHKPHSFYIDRYPLGREATVAWGVVDLRFRNDTPHGILIQAGIEPSSPGSDGAMNVRMWSTKHWDITAGVSERYDYTEEQTRFIDDPNCTPNDGYGGFDVDVYRTFRRPGSEEVVRRERMHTTYTPSDTVVCR